MASTTTRDSRAAASAARVSGAPLLTLTGVDKAYSNGVVALQGVDLTIRDGEFVSLLGPSGCGKSTLLRIIAGLGNITGGTLNWGEGLGHGGRQAIGFVFQEPTLMPWATVFDNAMLALRLRGMSRSEARPRVERALEQVGLTGFERAYPRELSGGMRMRVSVARALVAEPRILLMDEPFAALDEITRFRLNEDLLRLWSDQKWTIVFVTHSVYESVYLSSRVVIMHRAPGRVHTEFDVGAPNPRPEDYRTSPTYNDHCRTVSARLSETMKD